jgi:hypothetical protein
MASHYLLYSPGYVSDRKESVLLLDIYHAVVHAVTVFIRVEPQVIIIVVIVNQIQIDISSKHIAITVGDYAIKQLENY